MTPFAMCRAGIFLALTLLPTSAFAELKICNRTGEAQHIALGYKGATDWTSEGWWRIKSGSCTTVISGDLTRRFYYYHADNQSDTFVGEDFKFCTDQSVFTITGDTECEARGFDSTDFREIDTGKTATSFTLRLTNAELGTPNEVREPPLSTDTPNVPLIGAKTLKADFPAGTFGKPVEFEALFQGCELESGDAYCSFHNKGHKFRAKYDGATPADMLLALEDIPILNRVLVRADQLARKGREASVVLREVIPLPDPAPFFDIRRAFQGDWIDVANKNAAITVRGSEIYVRRDTKYRTTWFMDFADACPGATVEGPKLLQSTADEKEPKCYLVARADRELELLPVGGGHVLRYRRP